MATKRKKAEKQTVESDDFDDFYNDIFGDNLRKEIENRYRAFQNKFDTKLKEETDRLTAEFETKTKNLEEEYSKKLKTLEKREEVLMAKEEKYQKEIESVSELHKIQDKQIKLDVGGSCYTSSLSTLTSVPNSMLEAMFSGRHSLNKNEEGRIFIDRNGKLFEYVLDYLRNGEWDFPEDNHTLMKLYREIEYFGLTSPKLQYWKFEEHSKYEIGKGLEISNNGLTVTSTSRAEKASLVLGNLELKKNQVYYWELKMKGAVPYGMGVIDLTREPALNDYLCDNQVWYYDTDGSIAAPDDVDYYITREADNEDVIGVLVDLKKFLLTFYKNGKTLGIDLPLPKDAKLVPVVSFYEEGRISLQVKEPPK